MRNISDAIKHTVDKKAISKFLRNLEADIFYFKRKKNNKELFAIKQAIERFLSINSVGSVEREMRDLNEGLSHILQRVL